MFNDEGLGQAMAISYAEEQGKKALRENADLAVRVAKLERALLLYATAGVAHPVTTIEEMIRVLEERLDG